MCFDSIFGKFLAQNERTKVAMNIYLYGKIPNLCRGQLIPSPPPPHTHKALIPNGNSFSGYSPFLSCNCIANFVPRRRTTDKRMKTEVKLKHRCSTFSVNGEQTETNTYCASKVSIFSTKLPRNVCQMKCGNPCANFKTFLPPSIFRMLRK